MLYFHLKNITRPILPVRRVEPFDGERIQGTDPIRKQLTADVPPLEITRFATYITAQAVEESIRTQARTRTHKHMHMHTHAHAHIHAHIQHTFSVLANGAAISLAISGRRSTMLCTTAALPKCWKASPFRASVWKG